MEIKIPHSIEDMKITHLSRWTSLVKDLGEDKLEDLLDSWDFKMEAVSIFSGETKHTLERVQSSQLDKMFSDIIHKLSNFVPTEPRGTVKIPAREAVGLWRNFIRVVTLRKPIRPYEVYVFPRNFKKITTGQIIDLKGIRDLVENPAKGLALCYLPKGLKYGQTDSEGAIIQTNAEREEIFKNHFPGDEFLNWLSFFLNDYEKRKRSIYILRMARTRKSLTEIETELREEVETMKREKAPRRSRSGSHG